MTNSTPVEYDFLISSRYLIPLSIIAIFLNIGPLIWHARARNISTSSILSWVIILNLINFVNAAIWHNDDFENWFRGFYLCDIEVRLIVGASFGGLTGASLCLAQSLARVLDTESHKIIVARRQCVKDVLLCWALPIWFMVVYYAVQTMRYTISAGYGCGVPISSSWVTIVLMFIWPVVLMAITCYYTSMIIYRLHLYRSQVASLLQRSKTSQSRFTRLLILTVLMTLLVISLSLTQLIIFLKEQLVQPYSWHEVHNDWNYARFTPSDQSQNSHPERWVWIALGYICFITLGMGDEVRKQYCDVLWKLGFDNFLYRLSDAISTPSSKQIATWSSSARSHAKLIFGMKTKDSHGSDSLSPLSSLQSLRFSKLSSFSKQSSTLLPITEPTPATKKDFVTSRSGKWFLFARMPSFSQSFAGIMPGPMTTLRRTPLDVSSRIFITVPSPTLGGLSDDLILQMVGAEPAEKRYQ